jgi:chromosome segregation ATPase
LSNLNPNATQAPDSIVAEDREIIEHQLNGVESEKEAADVLVSRMLKEEADAGRGREQHESDDDDGGAEAEAGTPKETEADKIKAKQDEESRSQRRARLRRETIQRAQAERDKLQREVGRLQERLKTVEKRNPDRDAYGDDEATYVGDRAGFAAQYVATADQLEEVQQRVKAADEEVSRHQAQVVSDYFEEGNRKYPDFERTLRSDNLPFTPAMMEALLDEGMHDVAYELAKQPEEVARIAMLPNPVLQVKEILRVQARLESSAAERATTKAPPPIKPIRAAGAAPAKSPSEMTMEEYANYRKKQMASAR